MRRAIFTTIYNALREYGSTGQPVTTDELAQLTGLTTEQIAASLNHYIKRETDAGLGNHCDVQRVRSHVYRYDLKSVAMAEPEDTASDLGEQPKDPTTYEQVGVTSSGHPVVRHPVNGLLYLLEQL